jgi:hypothetical protein
MRRIHYASGTLLTGDAIADVVVRYAAALAKQGLAVELDVPMIDEAGETGSALLLLGPASQILAEHESAGDDLLDPDFVSSTEKAIDALGTPRAASVERGTEDTEAIDADYL